MIHAIYIYIYIDGFYFEVLIVKWTLWGWDKGDLETTEWCFIHVLEPFSMKHPAKWTHS